MTNCKSRLTPATMGEQIFCIPLYQRLFEWDQDRIVQLLEDLKGQDAGKDYYIGMLTSTTGNELVDGQQRMVVLILMGIVLSAYDKRWKDFIMPQGKQRLSFFARPDDEKYLEYLIGDGDLDAEVPFKNNKMCTGLRTIRGYVNDNDHFSTDDDRKVFARYVYERLTFFVTRLPDQYGKDALNKYFERMNSTGKNLEGHEIIKVKLLQKLLSDKEFYTKVWNRVADMDSPLFKTRKWKEEKEAQLKERIGSALRASSVRELFNLNLLNGCQDLKDDTVVGKPIKDIQERTDPPSKGPRTGSGTHAVMSFSDFLLQCLYWFLRKRQKETGEITVFFNKANIVKTFEKTLLKDADGEAIREFFDIIIRFRILLDVYFIRILDDEGDYDYDLETPFCEDGDEIKTLKMLESMIYVNSSPLTYYQWFGKLIELTDLKLAVTPSDLYKSFKQWDDKEHDLSKAGLLTYPNIDRYWFWRLDFWIWLNRKSLFPSGDEKGGDVAKALEVAEKYVFKRNRSIEHIAPQTPQQKATLELDEDVLNSFGNLVMISSEQNSSLSNSVYTEKKARVEAHLNNERSGSIESLKMLHAFTFHKEWNDDTIREHGGKMLELLKQSYAPKL